MPQTLTTQQSKLIQKISSGYTVHDAAIKAGYSESSATSHVYQLLRNPKISEALDKVGLTDNGLARTLKQNIKAGNKIKATADTTMRGLELAFKLKGYLDRAPDQANLSQTNIYINELKTMDDDSLQQKLDALLSDVEALKTAK